MGGVLAGFGDQREVELLVEAGFTPVEAIHIATANGAQFLGVLDHVGTLEAGKVADLMLIHGDPSKNIADIERVEDGLQGRRRLRLGETDRIRARAGRNPLRRFACQAAWLSIAAKTRGRRSEPPGRPSVRITRALRPLAASKLSTDKAP